MKTTFGVELSTLPAASMAWTRIWKSPGTVLALGVHAHVQPVLVPPGVSSVVSQYLKVELNPEPDVDPLQYWLFDRRFNEIRTWFTPTSSVAVPVNVMGANGSVCFGVAIGNVSSPFGRSVSCAGSGGAAATGAVPGIPNVRCTI